MDPDVLLKSLIRKIQTLHMQADYILGGLEHDGARAPIGRYCTRQEALDAVGSLRVFLDNVEEAYKQVTE